MGKCLSSLVSALLVREGSPYRYGILLTKQLVFRFNERSERIPWETVR